LGGGGGIYTDIPPVATPLVLFYNQDNFNDVYRLHTLV